MNERDSIFKQYKLIKEAEEQPTMKVDAEGTKFWRLPNGKLHREDGPAVEYANGDKEWYVNDKRYDTPSDWAEAVFKLHNKPHDQKSIDRFLKPILSKGLNDLL